MRTARWWLIPFVALLLALAPGCQSKPDDAKGGGNWPAGDRPKVVVSFAPLYCFAAAVAGDDAVVRNVMTNSGPHDFVPTKDDAKLVTGADLFFCVGLGLDEDKALAMKSTSGNTNLKVVQLGSRVDPKKLLEGSCTHDHSDGKGHDHKHGHDPHLWLSPDHAITFVNAIRDELKAADPSRAAGYDRRAADYVAKLEKLKADGQALLKGKKDNRIVTFHDALAYFSECYNIDIRGVLTQKPGQEPDAKELKKLIAICTDANKPTRVIAVEPQYSTSTSGETLRKELLAKSLTDAVLVEIDTLETVKPDELKVEWYETKMRANLDVLAKALK
jgi:zinc transport system substrate-binding protein